MIHVNDPAWWVAIDLHKHSIYEAGVTVATKPSLESPDLIGAKLYPPQPGRQPQITGSDPLTALNDSGLTRNLFQ